MDMVKYLVAGLVILVLASVLVPIGLTSIHSANTTGWSTAEITIFTTLGVLVLVGVMVGIVYMATKQK